MLLPRLVRLVFSLSVCGIDTTTSTTASDTGTGDETESVSSFHFNVSGAGFESGHEVRLPGCLRIYPWHHKQSVFRQLA